MNNGLTIGALLAVLVAGCGSSTSLTTPGSTPSMAGTWLGMGTDSTTAALGTGGMMGQAGMGTMTWQLTQSGSNVTGTMRFTDMPGNMMGGTFSGTMSGRDMTFTMDMPMGSMMSGGTCAVHASGTAHMDPDDMHMTGSYTGTNSCSGPFNHGQMTMTRR